MEKKTLLADNRVIGDKVVTVTATKQDIERHAKQFFNWRGSTKRYNSVFERVMTQGTSKFDDFVEYMYNQGY